MQVAGASHEVDCDPIEPRTLLQVAALDGLPADVANGGSLGPQVAHLMGNVAGFRGGLDGLVESVEDAVGHAHAQQASRQVQPIAGGPMDGDSLLERHERAG